MEFLLGLISLFIGGYLFYLGIKMFIESDGWFYLVKAIIVTFIGLCFLMGAWLGFFG